MAEENLKRIFSTFHLEDEVSLAGEANVGVRGYMVGDVASNREAEVKGGANTMKIDGRATRSNRVETHVTRFRDYIMKWSLVSQLRM